MVTAIEISSKRGGQRRAKKVRRQRPLKVIRRKSRAPRRQTTRATPMLYSTLPGKAFLEDSFSPPDFQCLEVFGVPDRYVGQTLVKQHLFSGRVPNATSDHQILYIMVAPIPGIAYLYAWGSPTAIPDHSVFEPVPFIDTAITFPSGLEDSNFTKFRYVSLCAEVTTTANLINIAGSLSVAQTPLTLVNNATLQAGDDDTRYQINGSRGLLSVINRSSFTKPTNEGAYSVSTHKQPDWDFKPIINGLTAKGLPDNKILEFAGNETFGINLGNDTALGPSVTGWGDHDTIIMAYVANNVDEPEPGFHIAVWATVEYQVQTDSILADMAHASPGLDQCALDTYAQMAAAIPPAVVQKKNAGFWSTLLSGITSAGNVIGSLVPGPWGAVARGVGGLGAAIGGLNG